MIIVLNDQEVLVWGIPPLSPHPPDLLNDNPTHISPLLKTSLPDDITRNSELILWETILNWYAGSSQSIHLGVSAEDWDSNHNVKIVIKPDLSDISLHVINTCQLAPDFHTLYPRYHILEDHTHVSQAYLMDDHEGMIYIRSTSSPPSNIISSESPIFLKLSLPGVEAHSMSTSSCPASGRFVYIPRDDTLEDNLEIVVVDFLEYV
jgi:hypothetical protein